MALWPIGGLYDVAVAVGGRYICSCRTVEGRYDMIALCRRYACTLSMHGAGYAADSGACTVAVSEREGRCLQIDYCLRRHCSMYKIERGGPLI